MKRLLLLALLALVGCSTSYDWEVDHKTGTCYLAGTHQTFDGQKTAAVADALTQVVGDGVGRFAQGYAEGSAIQQDAPQYQAPAPVVYQHPQSGSAVTFQNGQQYNTFYSPGSSTTWGPNNYRSTSFYQPR
jgi:hypothetical protein